MKKLSKNDQREKVRQRVVILLASIDQFGINTLKHVDSIALDELAHAKDMIYERLNNAFDRMERVVDAKNQTEFSFDRPAINFGPIVVDPDKSSFPQGKDYHDERAVVHSDKQEEIDTPTEGPKLK